MVQTQNQNQNVQASTQTPVKESVNEKAIFSAQMPISLMKKLEMHQRFRILFRNI